MSDTPRTDAQQDRADQYVLEYNPYVVPASFARILERELAETKTKLAEVTAACDKFSNAEILNGDWRARAEAAEAKVNEADTVLRAWHKAFGTSQLTHAVAKLKAAEAKVKALREALLKYVEWHGPCLDCHPDDAGTADAEAADIDKAVNTALAQTEDKS